MNYMVFQCALTRSEKRACATRKPLILLQTNYAIGKARVCYSAKDYLSAAQWQNAAERASLEMC